MWQRPARIPRPSATELPNWLLRGFLTAFLAGSLLFAYFFYTSVRDIVAYADLPFTAERPLPPAEAALPPGAVPGPQPPAIGAEPLPPGPRAADRCINVLILGIDERSDQQGPWRTDTMILCSLDPVSQTVAMLSIPRDLWVPLPPGLQYSHDDRINTAHFWGDYYGYPGGGPALAKRTVQYNLGVPVQYYVRVDFRGFQRIIDEIGGIDVEVPRDIIDTAYPVTGDEVMTLTIKAGLQHMDGDLALKYARTRHDSSDIDRAHRQQQVIMAVRDKVMRLDIPLTRLPAILATLGTSLKTDAPLEKLIALASGGRQVQPGAIRQAVIDGSMTTRWTAPGGAEVLVPQREKIRALVSQLFPTGTATAMVDGQ